MSGRVISGYVMSANEDSSIFLIAPICGYLLFCVWTYDVRPLLFFPLNVWRKTTIVLSYETWICPCTRGSFHHWHEYVLVPGGSFHHWHGSVLVPGGSFYHWHVSVLVPGDPSVTDMVLSFHHRHGYVPVPGDPSITDIDMSLYSGITDTCTLRCQPAKEIKTFAQYKCRGPQLSLSLIITLFFRVKKSLKWGTVSKPLALYSLSWTRK